MTSKPAAPRRWFRRPRRDATARTDGRIVEEPNTIVVASLHDSRYPLGRQARADALALHRGTPPPPTP
jgi:hypothetical protein